jgi:metal transporter CNNM
MILLSPLCYPIAWLLDKLLGHSEVGPESMSKSEIKALLDIQAEKSSYLLSGDDPEREPLNHAHTLDVSGISLYEASIMKSALDLDRRTAMDILIPMKFAFMLDYNTDLDLKVLRSISSSGFSRIPVYSKTKNNIKGIAHINSLIMVNPADKMPLNTIPLRNPIFVSPSASLMQLLTIFRNGESHLAIITESYNACEQFAKIKKDLPPDAKILGIVTLEDVLEELIQEEIYDENELSSESPKRKVALLCSKSQIMSQSSKRRHMYSKSLEIRKENRSLRVSNSHPDFQNISFLTEFSGSGSINSSDQNQSA